MKTESIISICNGTELIFRANGTYILKHTDAVEENYDIEALCVIQCFSNGCVNRVPAENVLSLRYDYTYSHGVFPQTNQMVCILAKDDDYIEVKYFRNGSEKSTKTKVGDLRAHTILGLKGTDIIKLSFDQITGWFKNDERIDSVKEKAKETVVSKSASISLEPVTDDLSELTKVQNKVALQTRFSGYLIDKRYIHFGQQHAKDLLAKCRSKEEIWYVIETLLGCSALVYRSPIVEYFKEHNVPQFKPDSDTLSLICKLLFSIDVKPEKNLEFLYIFRDIVTDDIKAELSNSIQSFSRPDQYQKMGDVLGMSSAELIEYCLEESSVASYYCVYESLLNMHKKEGYFAVSKVIATYIDDIDDSAIEGKLIKRLIFHDIKMAKNDSGAEIAIIKAGGFEEYARICASFKGKKENQLVQSSITSYVGKNVDGKYVATYSNHYFLMTSNGLRVMLPKNMSQRILGEGDSAKVLVAYADKTYNTLYATQRTPIDYKKIMQMPLLNIGDIIEVTFDLYGNSVPHKCYKKIKVSIDSLPRKFDMQARYKAKVIKQTIDKYHYIVKLV